MKKILTVSLFAMMAVSAANADIASTDYVGDQMALAEKIANKVDEVALENASSEKYTSEKAVRDAINLVKNELNGGVGDLSTTVEGLSSDVETIQGQLSATGTTGKAIADNAAAITAMDAAYKAADTATLNSAKSYADGLATNYDAKGSAAQALVDAKAYTDDEIEALETSLGTTSGDLTALTTRVGTAEGKITTIEGQQTTQDGKISALETSLSASGTTGKAIADNAAAITAMDAAYKAADTATLNSAKAFTTEQIDALGKLATIDTACAQGVTDCALVIRGGEIKWEKVSY